MRPVHAKRPGNLFDLVSTVRFCQQNQSIHSRFSLAGIGLQHCAQQFFLLLDQKQGVEHDRFSEGN